MSLLSQNKKDDKKGKKASPAPVGGKTNVKAGKGPAVAKKPVKTGGTRGS